MPKFKYTAINASGEKITGVLEGKNSESVRKQLTRKRLTVQRVSLDWGSIEIGGGSPIKSRDVVVFTRQMAVMLGAGLPLNRTLDIMIEQCDNKSLKKVLQAIHLDVGSGEPLSTSLQKHPKVFSALYVNMVSSGEISGKLAQALENLATNMEKSEEINRKVKSAMVYPIAVLGIAFGAVLLMYYFVIPNFAPMFAELPQDKPLPLLTRINLAGSNLLRENPLIFFGSIIGSGFGLKYLFKNPVVKAAVDQWGIRLPVIGPIIVKAAVARFARTMSSLLTNGVNLIEALSLTSESAGNQHVAKSIEAAKNSIMGGSDIATPLAKAKIFPPMVIQMIKVGEETGELDVMLSKVADIYEDEVRRAVEGAIKLIEPMMMVVIGGVIGGILMSVYLPMFDSMMSMGQE